MEKRNKLFFLLIIQKMHRRMKAFQELLEKAPTTRGLKQALQQSRKRVNFLKSHLKINKQVNHERIFKKIKITSFHLSQRIQFTKITSYLEQNLELSLLLTHRHTKIYLSVVPSRPTVFNCCPTIYKVISDFSSIKCRKHFYFQTNF